MSTPGYTPAHGSPADGEQGGAIGPGPAMTPYHGGPADPVEAMGDADAGGRDDVATTVQGATENANARWHEHESDVLGHGGGHRAGDILTLPVSPLDPGVGSTGTTDPAGAFFDPPREYSTDPGGSGAPVQSYPVDPSGN